MFILVALHTAERLVKQLKITESSPKGTEQNLKKKKNEEENGLISYVCTVFNVWTPWQ